MSDNAADAMQLLQALGPHAGPAPITLNVVTMKTGDGQQWVVPIISHPFGRVAPWLTPDDAAEWGNLIVANATNVKARPSPLQVARTIPQGLPQPGAMPPAAPMPPHRGRLN